MNKVKVYVFEGIKKELKERLAKRVKAETMEDLKERIKPIEKFLQDYYKMFPSRKPIEDIRPFCCNRVDHDFQLEKDREEYDSERAEMEENL